MNWRRGLIRLWLVASVLWTSINGFAFRVPDAVEEVTPWLRPMRLSDLPFDQKQPENGPSTKYPGLEADNRFAKFLNNDDLARAREAAAERRRGAIANLRGFAIFGLGVPLAVLVLSIVGCWVIRGFKPTGSQL